MRSTGGWAAASLTLATGRPPGRSCWAVGADVVLRSVTRSGGAGSMASAQPIGRSSLPVSRASQVATFRLLMKASMYFGRSAGL